MERIWLRILGYRVCNIRRSKGEPGYAYFDIRLGDMVLVEGVKIKYQEEGDRPALLQNWGTASVRFPDVSILHRHTSKRNPLLHDVLASALTECFSELLQALQNGSQKQELRFIEPKEWDGKALRIPVDFVKFNKLMCGGINQPVYTDFWVGHHFIICGVKIFNGLELGLDKEGCSKILSPTLCWLVDKLCRQVKVQEAVHGVSTEGTADTDADFMIGVKGCDPDGIPPAIRFY